MGLLNKAIAWRRLFMKIFEIDNTNLLNAIPISNLGVKKGNKIILIPSHSNIIKTNGYLPHLQRGTFTLKYCHKCKNWLILQCFIKNKYSADGYKDCCSHCDNQRRKKRYAKIRAVT